MAGPHERHNHKLVRLVYQRLGVVIVALMDYRSKEEREEEKLAFGKRVRLGASRRGNFPFPKRSLPFGTALPFRTIVYCRCHEEDQIVIAEIQLILTLTLIQTKIK